MLPKRMSFIRFTLLVALACIQWGTAPSAVHASPCSGMAWHMTKSETGSIAPAIAIQLKPSLPDIAKVVILDAYRYGS